MSEGRLIDDIPTDWREALAATIDSPPFRDIEEFLAQERARTDAAIYPPESLVFAALRLTPLTSVRAVILGQDPYYKEGLATGLAFSVPDGCEHPLSLRNIMKARELDLDLPVPVNGSLDQWARNGVLLLNAALTVPRHDAERHLDFWSPFTDEIVKTVVALPWPVAFLLWVRISLKWPCQSARNGHPGSGFWPPPRRPRQRPTRGVDFIP